jgi:hypothetical protein
VLILFLVMNSNEDHVVKTKELEGIEMVNSPEVIENKGVLPSATAASGLVGSPASASAPIEFPPPTKEITPCSYGECSMGHRFPPTMAVGKCQGDQAPILAIMKVNCPTCNEPTVKMSIRCDVVPRGAGVAMRCQGQMPFGESIDIGFELNEWKRAQLATVDFDTKSREEAESAKS